MMFCWGGGDTEIGRSLSGAGERSKKVQLTIQSVFQYLPLFNSRFAMAVPMRVSLENQTRLAREIRSGPRTEATFFLSELATRSEARACLL